MDISACVPLSPPPEQVRRECAETARDLRRLGVKAVVWDLDQTILRTHTGGGVAENKLTCDWFKRHVL